MALEPGGKASHLAMHALHAAQQIAHVHQQGFASRRELHAARATHEQGRAHRVFEILEAVAGGGCRDVDGGRAAGQALCFCNRLEQAQVGEFVAH